MTDKKSTDEPTMTLEELSELLSIPKDEIVRRVEAGEQPYCDDAIRQGDTYVFKTEKIHLDEPRSLEYCATFLNRTQAEVAQLIREGKLRAWPDEKGELRSTSRELRRFAEKYKVFG